MRIAVFDSGAGGLSVLSHARRVLPDAEFLFFADCDHVPYGTKSIEAVCGFVREGLRFLVEEQRADAVLIACNTATSAAADEMRQRYDLPIIGMEPAVKKALAHDDTHRVLVAATPITVQGEKLRQLIAAQRADHLVDLLALPCLVEFAEQQEFVSPRVEEYLCSALQSFDLAAYSALVLGCTHFNYFKDTLRKLLPPTVRLVDGTEETVEELARRVGIPMAAAGTRKAYCQFFASRRLITDADMLARIEHYLQRAEEMARIV